MSAEKKGCEKTWLYELKYDPMNRKSKWWSVFGKKYPAAVCWALSGGRDGLFPKANWLEFKERKRFADANVDWQI